MDAYETMRIGEVRDLEGVFTPESGTITLSSATVSLYDASGAIAGDVDEADATGITSGASAAPVAWYTFDLTDDGLGINAGLYTLTLSAVDSDGKDYITSIGVRVKNAYDP